MTQIRMTENTIRFGFSVAQPAEKFIEDHHGELNEIDELYMTQAKNNPVQRGRGFRGRGRGGYRGGRGSRGGRGAAAAQGRGTLNPVAVQQQR